MGIICNISINYFIIFFISISERLIRKKIIKYDDWDLAKSLLLLIFIKQH